MSDSELRPSSGAPGWNMYVFRDGRQAVSGPKLRAELADALRAVPASADVRDNELIEALLRAGELECALADAQHPGEAQLACITDGLAARLVGDANAPSPSSLVAHLPASLPATVHVSPPEGFAYYALHPRDMADLAAQAPSRSHHVAVVGIRTIGLTLSAVVLAELRKRGRHARRISVRPTGHPYDRRTVFTDEQKAVLCQYRNLNADFLVTDEGPGMSGSSFLSAADALVAARVPRDRITLLCSRQPDVAQLRASNAQERWPQHRALFVRPNSFLPAGAEIYAGAGLWRQHLFASQDEWPESWLHMERLKFFSPDKRVLFKFEGFGRYGRAVHDRAQRLHAAGFGPSCGTPQYGFGVYPVRNGHLMRASDLSRDMISQIAHYCAMRARDFAVDYAHPHQQMEEMTRFNFHEEFGRELDLPGGALATESPAIADARMHPHEWLRAKDGGIVKLDGVEHGDDHFFPGPTDIAWDLAGAIVEWNMDADAQQTLLRDYRSSATRDAELEQRVAAFVLAYTSFRMGYCKMAAEAVRGSGEEHRLVRAYQRYRDHLAGIAPASRDTATVPLAQAAAEENNRAPVILNGPSPEPLAA